MMRSLCNFCLALLAAAALPVGAQQAPGQGAGAPAITPLGKAVVLRLTGSQRFRAILEVRNSGDSPARQFRYATLVADGSVAPAPGGYAWQFDLNRAAVDARSLGGGETLATVRLLTDERWSVLATASRFAPSLHDQAVDSLLRELIVAAAEMLATGFGVLPQASLAQDSPLPAYDDAIRALLAWGWKSIDLASPVPELRVVGGRQLFGRQTLVAAGKSPVTFVTPLGRSSLNAEGQREIALDSGLPLVTSMRLSGELPAGAARVDASLRVTLRPL